jgi:Ca-activated chloride channel family protein
MIRPAVLMLVAAACSLAAQEPAPQSKLYRSTTDLVPLFVTVGDSSGRLVTDLTRDDFQVFDNGKPQPIAHFDRAPQPIRLIVMIDTSGSMDGNLPLLKAACLELIRHLGPGDLARIGTFGEEVRITPTFTRDTNELIAALPASIPKDAPTPLWSGVDQALTELASAAEGRRVVMVLGDGKDSGPVAGRTFMIHPDISARAQREDVMIYGIGVRSSLKSAMRSAEGRTVGDVMASTLVDPGLGTVALDTGGGYLEARGGDDLAATFRRVMDELHQQYLIGFVPPVRDGKVHKVEVRTSRSGLKPRVRKSYVAPK